MRISHKVLANWTLTKHGKIMVAPQQTIESWSKQRPNQIKEIYLPFFYVSIEEETLVKTKQAREMLLYGT